MDFSVKDFFSNRGFKIIILKVGDYLWWYKYIVDYLENVVCRNFSLKVKFLNLVFFFYFDYLKI